MLHVLDACAQAAVNTVIAIRVPSFSLGDTTPNVFGALNRYHFERVSYLGITGQPATLDTTPVTSERRKVSPRHGCIILHLIEGTPLGRLNRHIPIGLERKIYIKKMAEIYFAKQRKHCQFIILRNSSFLYPMEQLRSPSSQVIVWFFPMTINRIKKTGRSLERQKVLRFHVSHI